MSGNLKTKSLRQALTIAILIFASSSFFLVREGSTLGPGPPTPPRNLSATPTVVGIALNWLAPLDNGSFPIMGYNIYRNTSSTSPIRLTVGNVTSFIDTSVAMNTTYTYNITAVNRQMFESSPSNTASATTFTFPTATTSVVATAGTGEITLTWNSPSSNGGSTITAFAIFRATTSGAETPLTTISPITSFKDTQVTAGTAYYYKVAAISAVGQGALSNEVSATPLAPQTPQSVGFLETYAPWIILVSSLSSLAIGYGLGTLPLLRGGWEDEGDKYEKAKALINSDEEFDKFKQKLRKELEDYKKNLGSSEPEKAQRSNVDYVLDNMEACDAKNLTLAEKKKCLDDLLRRVTFVKAFAAVWLAGFNFYKAALNAVLTGEIDFEVVDKALEFFITAADESGDSEFKKVLKNAEDLKHALEKAKDSKEKLEKLKDGIKKVVEGLQKKSE